MSVIIENMNMPKGCGVCRFSDRTECILTGWEIGWYGRSQDKVSPLCQLKALPPHGDLIDRDALNKEYKKEEGGIYSVNWSRFLRRFNTVPPVIPGNIPKEEGEG